MAVDSMSDSRARGPGFDTQFGHILSFLLSLIQGSSVGRIYSDCEQIYKLCCCNLLKIGYEFRL